jgi:putative spermidine/putrescine transport system substrate-binding protein
MRTPILFAALLGGLALAQPMPDAAARDFTIASWGGAYQDAHRKNYFEPTAEKLGIPVLENVYQGGWAQFKAVQETGVLPFDIAQVEVSEVIRGCEEGLFMVIDWSRIANADDLVPSARHECGLGVVSVGHVLAYNAEILKTPPTTSADFFDLEKFPGKRALRKFPKNNLEFALMADGVPLEEVYEVISTPEGLDRAFAKLDTIKSETLWWEGGAQAPEWLITGEVVMARAYSGRILNARKEGHDLRAVWDHATYDQDSWIVLEASPYHDYAYEFFNIFTDPQRQAGFVEDIAYAPTNTKAIEYIDPEVLPYLAIGDNLDTVLFIGGDESNEFWLNHLDEVVERFNAWLAS